LEIRNKIKHMRMIIFLLILTSSSLFAGSILKWVDEDGNIHYGDTPPIAVETERVRVLSAPSNPGKALPRLSTDGSTGNSNNRGTNVAAGGDQEDLKLPADQAQIACDEATADLKVIKRSNRIRLRSADGTTRYMTTEEIKTRQETAEKDVSLHCA
ncbi:MAG: DUF4124 domain-containing protein, partial [Gammaproteobacteria bacterium]